MNTNPSRADVSVWCLGVVRDVLCQTEGLLSVQHLVLHD